MPIYEYLAVDRERACDRCREPYEVLQRMKDEPLTTCDECGGPVRRIISRSSFILKGDGWYADGYQRKQDS
ncbi:zinc ribbon domain-containing protein [Candidatus Woesearchaeota archaeon]|nr:MAG: zinc ribbon domain-containing protein [Candidatus Woesearchaeota archaeon]